MILGDFIDIQQKTVIQDDEGVSRPVWHDIKRNVSCSFQPYKLNEVDLEAWGVTDRAANSKRVFLPRDNGIEELMRCKHGNKYYEIRGINNWPMHTELLCIPVAE